MKYRQNRREQRKNHMRMKKRQRKNIWRKK
jgi:hypothetical protein